MRGNIKSFEKPFTHAEVVALADRTLKRFGGDRARAGRYARSMEDRYESSKWAQVVEVLATSRTPGPVSSHHATRKTPKTPAQLEREIDAALSGTDRRTLDEYLQIANHAAVWAGPQRVPAPPQLQPYTKRVPKSRVTDRQFWLGEVLSDLRRDAEKDLTRSEMIRFDQVIGLIVAPPPPRYGSARG